MKAFVLTALMVVSATVFADDGKAPAPTAKVLVTQDLVSIPGKEAVVLTVEYPPGGASAAHRHDAEVFVYVLEGSVIMQVDGQSPVTLKPGQTFHEKPTDIHRTSANASKTEPAKFLVFIVKEKGKAVTTPVPAS